MKKILIFNCLFIIFLSCKEKEIKNNNKISESEHLIMSVVWFQKSAELKAIFYQTYAMAKMSLEKNISESKSKKKKAVVLDLDETVLDNSPFEAKCIETGKSFNSKSWKEWVDLSKAEILPGAKDFLFFAKEKNVEVFYISNRKHRDLEATIKNLKKYDLPNADKEHVFLRDGKNTTKKSRRSKVKENFEIVLFIGDNLGDFSEIYENRNEKLAFDIVEKNKNDFGKKFIILPNPMYGEWENAIYGNKKLSNDEKISIRKDVLISY